MKTEDNELLLQVFSSVFEDFAFMFVDDAPDYEADEASGPGLKSKIEFKSRNLKGFLEVAAPLDFCNETARNILGVEMEQLPKNAGDHALKELVNIACGFLLAEKFGTEEIFDLSVPQTTKLSKRKWNFMLKEKEHLLFSVDESPLVARYDYQN